MRSPGDLPVQQRSIATRAALLDAALECIVDRGYAATTTIEVARRAGVSRGAQLHHFATKAQLVTAAVQHLIDRRITEFQASLDRVDPGADRLDAALDLLWSMFDGPAFATWVELWIAARTDPDLAAEVVAMDERFTAESRAMFLAIFADDVAREPVLYDIGRDLAFAVMTGVALQRLVPRGQRPAAEYVDVLKRVFHVLRQQPPAEDRS